MDNDDSGIPELPELPESSPEAEKVEKDYMEKLLKSWVWRRFLKWLAPRRHIWDRYCQIIAEAQARGVRRFNISLPTEILREFYKDGISNTYRAYMARLWQLEHPEWPRFFEFRRSKADPALPSDQLDLFEPI